MVSRLDVKKGRVAPKVIENGVIVVPALQINELTLYEHRWHIRGTRWRPLDPEEEARMFPDEAPEPAKEGVTA